MVREYKVMRRHTGWRNGTRCPGTNKDGSQCGYWAGERTGHPGYGSCSSHGGAWPQIEELWRDAMDVAEVMEVTPYEALLLSVKQAGGRAAWTELQLREAVQRHVDGGGVTSIPSKDVKYWIQQSRTERTLFAKTAQVAVQAGVAAALVKRVEMEGAAVADAVLAALDALDLTPEQRMAALGAAQDRLLSIGSGTVEG